MSFEYLKRERESIGLQRCDNVQLSARPKSPEKAELNGQTDARTEGEAERQLEIWEIGPREGRRSEDICYSLPILIASLSTVLSTNILNEQ